MEDHHSLAAKLLIVSGKLSGLSEGFTFYQTPTGEKVNSRILTAYLIAATIEDLKNKGVIDYKEGEIKALIGGKIPVLILNRKKQEGVGFEKIVLEKLEKEKNLIDLIRDILGGMYQIPEHRILWLIGSEFPEAEYKRQEKVTVMFILSRMETRWIPEKVTPLADKWLPELKLIWENVLKLPWLKTAIRNVNFGLSARKAQDKDDD